MCKRKKEDKNDDNKGKKQKKTAKTKCKFRGEELLGPQASLRVTPCPSAPNHTRGEVIRPPSQIENNSYNVIRTATSMTSLALVARLRFQLDHLEIACYISINCRCKGEGTLGGRVRNFVQSKLVSILPLQIHGLTSVNGF